MKHVADQLRELADQVTPDATLTGVTYQLLRVAHYIPPTPENLYRLIRVALLLNVAGQPGHTSTAADIAEELEYLAQEVQDLP